MIQPLVSNVFAVHNRVPVGQCGRVFERGRRGDVEGVLSLGQLVHHGGVLPSGGARSGIGYCGAVCWGFGC